MLCLTNEDIKSKLVELRKTVKPIDPIALCGKCRYNEEMADLYTKTSYIYCECKNGKGIMILYNNNNKHYKRWYLEEMQKSVFEKHNQYEVYLDTIPYWHIFKIIKIKTIIGDLWGMYMDLLAEWIVEFKNVNSVRSDVPFVPVDPPRNI